MAFTFFCSWKEPPTWFKRLGDLLKMFGSKLRDNLFTRPAEDAKRSYATIWSVIGAALQSDTATFTRTDEIRALVDDDDASDTIRASVVMTYMTDLLQRGGDMKRAQALFAAVQKTVASTSKYAPWAQAWKTPVRLADLDWRALLPDKQDLLRDLLLFWELHARQSLPVTDSLTHGEGACWLKRRWALFLLILFSRRHLVTARRR